jgi:lysophospholipase
MKIEIIKDSDFTKEIPKIEDFLKNKKVSGFLNKKDDSVKLFYEYYLAENPKANIVILHGFTEFTAKYNEIIYYLFKSDYNVFIFDLRGHGFSTREVDNPHYAHIESYDDYVSDLEFFIEKLVEDKGKNKDIYLYSHSMGGAISLLYIMKNPRKIKKAVLSSPMIVPKTGNVPKFIFIPVVKRNVKKDKDGWKGKFFAAKDFNPDFKYRQDIFASMNRLNYYQKLRVNEPMYQNSCQTNRWIYETMNLKNRLLDKKSLSKINTKFLILSGDNDGVVKNKYQYILKNRLKDATIENFSNANHTLYALKDDEEERYFNLIFDFLDK